ncbi:guanylate kinase [Coleophoma crateriformis]|uniref:Guanylate kinase n=1 Tax=Coleophoma crateriformis TaxID=565419 RepID=A0A3D8SYR6_9HELO|nr:guanylate kinase [Coleophoma crateriformis]
MAPTLKDLRPVVISGPSGVGKGTLYSKLMTKYPGTFATTVSHTTRDPRPGEKRDVDYYYISMEDFEAMISRDEFVEHAKFGGNRYGTSKRTIKDLTSSGKLVLLDIEMETHHFLSSNFRGLWWLILIAFACEQGVKQIKNSDISARFVFIAPPSMETLEARLRGRGTEKEDSIQKRLAQAEKELEYSKTEGAHDLIIVNDDLDKAFKELEGFVFGAEVTQD